MTKKRKEKRKEILKNWDNYKNKIIEVESMGKFTGGKLRAPVLKKIKDNLPKTDMCLILKVLDIIDDKRHELSKKIIKCVKCRHLLVSFSTQKLSGKPMNKPERRWFEELLEKENLKFEKFMSNNEIFYLIKR
jgi:hypothetical protein